MDMPRAMGMIALPWPVQDSLSLFKVFYGGKGTKLRIVVADAEGNG
jgi:hypothetical protein